MSSPTPSSTLRAGQISSDAERSPSVSSEVRESHATSPAASAAHAGQGTAEEPSQYCDVYIPGVVHPLHVELAAGVEATTVEAMRELVLHALNAQRGTHATRSAPSQYVRLMFRGKELQLPKRSLAQYGVVSGSAVHALVTSMQPRNQGVDYGMPSALGPLASRDVRDAREAITTAFSALWTSAEPTTAVPTPGGPTTSVTDTGPSSNGNTRSSLYAVGGGESGDAAAVSRAQLTNNELLRLLQQERMLRNQAIPLPRPAQQSAGETTQTPVSERQYGEEHVLSSQAPTRTAAVPAEALDGGVTAANEANGNTTTATLAANEVGDDEVERLSATIRRRDVKVMGQAFVVGFLLGPLCCILPIEDAVGRAGLLLGCIANIVMFWVTYSESYV